MNTMTTIFVKILTKFMTERFISKMIVIGLKKLATSTDNDLDDEIAKAVETALGNPLDETDKEL